MKPWTLLHEAMDAFLEIFSALADGQRPAQQIELAVEVIEPAIAGNLAGQFPGSLH